MKPMDPRADLEDRILDVVREKRLSFSALQKAEKDAGVPSGTKPTTEQLQAVLDALVAL
jgi:predicted double-glycine peptidase